jgi:membrane protein YdbS with pleckstrin-like domain
MDSPEVRRRYLESQKLGSLLAMPLIALLVLLAFATGNWIAAFAEIALWVFLLVFVRWIGRELTRLGGEIRDRSQS